jgi:hypothetical protein
VVKRVFMLPQLSSPGTRCPSSTHIHMPMRFQDFLPLERDVCVRAEAEPEAGHMPLG